MLPAPPSPPRAPRPPRRRRLAVARWLAAAVACSAGAPGIASADEGQWTPDQISTLDLTAARSRGLELTPEQLWDPNGGGLMRAVVNLGGCTASFVSQDGLIATNHHCAYGALQSQSTVEHDYLKDGFLARSRADELEARGKTVRVLESIEDVTPRVTAAIAAAADDRGRGAAIERVEKELVAACEDEPQLRCQVAAFYGGNDYRLLRYRELLDVRLVYAPPSAIGEYGGEIDNWMWPRHTGDFSLLRAYTSPAGAPAPFAAENVPYKPAQWLRAATEGVAPGEFVAVMGYPGHTDRYLPAVEVRRQVEQVLPTRIELYGAWIALLEQLGEGDRGRAIKVASMKKSLANRHKNARGMLAGLRRMDFVARRDQEDQALAAWTETREGAPFKDVLPALAERGQRLRVGHMRRLLLGHVDRGPNLLAVAIDLVRRARTRALPDLERPEPYMDRNVDRLWKKEEQRLRDYDLEVDATLLADLLARAAALPADQAIAGFTAVIERAGPSARAREDFLPLARSLLRASSVADEAWVRARFDDPDPGALAGNDPLLRLASALAGDLEAEEDEADARAGEGWRLSPRYFEMRRRSHDGPIYPDANGTLRLSLASVRGYSPQEGLSATPQTTVAGQLAKHTGEEPFDLPERVREAAARARESYWSEPTLGDVPVCFLADADTTGGNSGSPVINGRGELVGFNFDRVWENIAGDFAYSSERSRNIIVDLRYLLWLLDAVDDAGALLTELGVADRRGQGPRALEVPASTDKPECPPPAPARAAKASCACAAASSHGDARAVVLIACLALAGRRRRRR